MLVAITVIMAASLVSFAIVFDSLVLDRETILPDADISDTFYDIINGRIWNAIVTQLEQLS
jgi:hypothetical protein